MLNPNHIAQDIATLPESAQILLLQLIQLLKQTQPTSTFGLNPDSSGLVNQINNPLLTTIQHTNPQPRQRGSAQGQIWMAPDFNEPLT